MDRQRPRKRGRCSAPALNKAVSSADRRREVDVPEGNTRGDVRRYGRRTFLLTTAAGFSSLFWGNAVWSQASKIVLPVIDVIAPGLIPGWRIYTIAGDMPTFDRSTWRLRIDGLVERPRRLTLRPAPRASTSRAGLGLPLRDRLVGRQRPLGAAFAFATCSRPFVPAGGAARSRSSRRSTRTPTR